MKSEATALQEVIHLFLRLGFTAFGGPAAHIAMMRQEVVERLGWMSDQHFLDLVGATNLIPGPNSTEMTIHIGYERAGWRGLLAAGICFILPAAVMVGLLAWLYVEFGATPQGDALLYGIKPVIIAIVLQALVKLGGTAVKNNLLIAICPSFQPSCCLPRSFSYNLPKPPLPFHTFLPYFSRWGQCCMAVGMCYWLFFATI